MKYEQLGRVFGNLSQLEGKVVSIIGLGTLGTHVAQLLARNGVTLHLFDPDIVEEKNLSTQILYGHDDVNKLKVIQAREALLRINPSLQIESFPLMITQENVDEIKANVIVDCTDNFRVRFILSDYCLYHKIPLVHGAALGEKGTVFVVTNISLRSLYPGLECLDSCETAGITNMTASTVAGLQVQQVMNILFNREHLKGFLRIDLSRHEFREYDASSLPSYTPKNNNELVMWDCVERDGWIVQRSEREDIDLARIKKKFKVITESSDTILIEVDGYQVVIYANGEVLVRGDIPLKELEKIGKLVL